MLLLVSHYSDGSPGDAGQYVRCVVVNPLGAKGWIRDQRGRYDDPLETETEVCCTGQKRIHLSSVHTCGMLNPEY